MLGAQVLRPGLRRSPSAQRRLWPVYTSACPDGRLGHLEDFVIDDLAWSIRSLVVDTRNWWPGKRVLIEPCTSRQFAGAIAKSIWLFRGSRSSSVLRFDGVMPPEASVVGEA